MTLQIFLCLAIFVLLIVLYVTQKLPMGVSAISCMLLLVLVGCLPAKDALAGFSKSNTLMIIGMFVVAAGLARTQLIPKVSGLVNRVGKGSFYKMFIGYLIVDLLLAQMLPSGITRFAMLYPLVMGMCEELDISPKKAIYPFAITNIATAAIIPIGAGATDYAKLNGYLESFQITDYSFNLLDPFLSRAPIFILAPLLSLLVLPRLAKLDKVAVGDGAVETLEKKKQKTQTAVLPPFQEFCGYAIFILVLVGLVTAKSTGIDLAVITLSGAMLSIITGVVDVKTAIKSLPVKVTCIYVGGLALSSALVSTGAGDLLGNVVVNLLGGITNPYVIVGVIFLVSFLLAQFISNSSAINILTPLVIATCMALGCSPVAPLLAVNAACLLGCLTPMSNVAIPIVMGLTGQSFWEIFKQGLPVLIIVLVEILWIPTMFPIW